MEHSDQIGPVEAESPSIDQRLAALDQEMTHCMVLHSRFKEALDCIESCRNAIGTRDERRACLIFGGSRSGKSKLLEYYLSSVPPRPMADGTCSTPVILVRLFADCSPLNLLSLLLSEMGDPCYGRGNVVERWDRLASYVKRKGVEVILIDEAQHFAARGQRATMAKTADFLKSLLTRTGIAVALAGIETVTTFLSVDEQVRNRFRRPYHLCFELPDSLALHHTGGRGMFTLLTALNRKLPSVDLTPLMNMPACERLYLASRGRLGIVLDLVQGGASHAFIDDRVKVTLNDLAKAFNKICDPVPAVGNPFAAEIAKVAAKLKSEMAGELDLQGATRKLRKAKKTVSVGEVLRV